MPMATSSNGPRWQAAGRSIPPKYHDPVPGPAKPVEDTPFNRAWIAAGKLFADEAKRISFYQRVEKVMPLAANKKYRKYVDREAGSFHIALLAAVAAVRFSFRTTPKALRAAFDAEFRRHLAATVDLGEPDKPQ